MVHRRAPVRLAAGTLRSIPRARRHDLKYCAASPRKMPSLQPLSCCLRRTPTAPRNRFKDVVYGVRALDSRV